MKQLIAALLMAALAEPASARIRLQAEPLASVPWADTEATTNLIFALGASAAWDAVLTLDFEATPSNNVEVAFGKDADGDGTLMPEEQEMTVGWDCGRWFVAGRSGRRGESGSLGVTEFSAAPVTETTQKVLSLKGGLFPNGSVRSLSLTENEAVLDFGFPSPLPAWFHRPDWDRVRVTVRGVDRAGERLALGATRIGTLVVIR